MVNKTLVTALMALTALNAVLSHSTGQLEATQIKVSSLDLNDSLPELRLREVGCRILVAFRSDCPFCRKAAGRESSTVDSGRLPTTWIASSGDPDWQSYKALVHATSDVVLDSTVYSMLEVQAVPAAFLLDGRGVLRWVWPYQGNEDQGDLIGKCVDPDLDA